MAECPECGMRDDDWFLCRREDCATRQVPNNEQSRAKIGEALEIAKGYILRSNNHWRDGDLAKVNEALLLLKGDAS
ncbi:hypothetical protein [Synechococcus phage Ssp-JY38]